MTASCSVNKIKLLPEVHISSGKADTGIRVSAFFVYRKMMDLFKSLDRRNLYGKQEKHKQEV